MAELLVKARTEPDLDPSRPGVWEQGEVVTVKPDGWQWGRKERPPRFVVVQAPNLSVTDAEAWLEDHRDDPASDGVPGVQGRLLHLRRFVLDLDALPDPAPDRAVEVTASRIRTNLMDRGA